MQSLIKQYALKYSAIARYIGDANRADVFKRVFY
jgi:hypothetical protein